MNAVESYSEEITRWIPITLQDRGMGFRYTALSSTSGARAGCGNLGFLDAVMIKCSSDTQFRLSSAIRVVLLVQLLIFAVIAFEYLNTLI